jgi:hypothetical protein
MSDNTRTIHTGLYTDRAHSLIGEIISDLKNWYSGAKKTKKIASLFNTNIKRGIDNEIILETTTQSYYYRNTRLWNGLTDNQVLRHIVWMYKGLIQQRAGSNAWKRENNGNVPHFYYDVKIREVYFLYDMFHQRNNFKRNYPDNYSDELIGIPLDPITVELKNAQLAEIENIKNEKERKLKELNTQKSRERDAAYKVIDMKYGTLIKEVEDMAATKIKQLKEEMKGIASLNLLANVG